MEKVKITQEQADAIERLEMNWEEDEIIARNVKGRVFKEPYNHSHRELEKLSLYDLLHALKYGYEVEPEFKVGDWVHSERNGVTARIRDISRAKLYIDSEEHDSIPIPDARHATPEEIAKEKERRWWFKHDRDVWELFEGDILKRLTDNEFVYVVEVGEGITTINIINDYTFEEYTKNELREEFSVLYLSEDRKDV